MYTFCLPVSTVTFVDLSKFPKMKTDPQDRLEQIVVTINIEIKSISWLVKHNCTTSAVSVSDNFV